MIGPCCVFSTVVEGEICCVHYLTLHELPAVDQFQYPPPSNRLLAEIARDANVDEVKAAKSEPVRVRAVGVRVRRTRVR
jgi:hypothetical protein